MQQIRLRTEVETTATKKEQATAKKATEEEPADETIVAPIDQATAAPFDKADTYTDGELSRAKYDATRADASDAHAATADATVEAPNDTMISLAQFNA